MLRNFGEPLHNSGANKRFRINTCKSVSKQTTLSAFRMNTYAKGGGGASWNKPDLFFTLDIRFLFAIMTIGKRKRETAGGSIALGLSRAAGRLISARIAATPIPSPQAA